jgi:hypothetical protein
MLTVYPTLQTFGREGFAVGLGVGFGLGLAVGLAVGFGFGAGVGSGLATVGVGGFLNRPCE